LSQPEPSTATALQSGRDSSYASGSNDKPRPLTGRALKYKLFVQIAEDETNEAIVAEATGWMFELRLEGYARCDCERGVGTRH